MSLEVKVGNFIRAYVDTQFVVVYGVLYIRTASKIIYREPILVTLIVYNIIGPNKINIYIPNITSTMNETNYYSIVY